MLVPNKNPTGYKENFISCIVFAFGEGVTIIDCLSNTKLYLSNIVESYKDSIIGHFGNSGTADLLLHIVQCWSAYAFYEYNRSLPMVFYFSVIIYIYYSRLGFSYQTQ